MPISFIRFFLVRFLIQVNAMLAKSSLRSSEAMHLKWVSLAVEQVQVAIVRAIQKDCAFQASTSAKWCIASKTHKVSRRTSKNNHLMWSDTSELAGREWNKWTGSLIAGNNANWHGCAVMRAMCTVTTYNLHSTSILPALKEKKSSKSTLSAIRYGQAIWPDPTTSLVFSSSTISCSCTPKWIRCT